MSVPSFIFETVTCCHYQWILDYMSTNLSVNTYHLVMSDVLYVYGVINPVGCPYHWCRVGSNAWTNQDITPTSQSSDKTRWRCIWIETHSSPQKFNTKDFRYWGIILSRNIYCLHSRYQSGTYHLFILDILLFSVNTYHLVTLDVL